MAIAVRPARLARSEPDERLVDRVRAGDETAFEAIYDRHSAGLLSFARHMLGDLEEAEDAVQHTFLAAHRALLGDDREIHLRAWLYAIARNRCLSVLRARRERVAHDGELEAIPSLAGLSSEVERREELRTLVSDLARLPDEQRAALVLAELGAHSHDEIAEVLGVRPKKVKALVFQGRESLGALRAAREAPCEGIREELATARGAALRKSALKRHLQVCAGCREFRDEVQRQRAAFGLILPVVPSIALKESILAATIGGGGGGAAIVAGAGGLGGAGAVAGAAGVGAAGMAGAGGLKAILGKTLITAAVASGAGGAGYVTVHEMGDGQREGTTSRAAETRKASDEPRSPTTVSTPLPERTATVTPVAAGKASARPKPNRKPRHKPTKRGPRGASSQPAPVSAAPAAPVITAAAPASPPAATPAEARPDKEHKPKKMPPGLAKPFPGKGNAYGREQAKAKHEQRAGESAPAPVAPAAEDDDTDDHPGQGHGRGRGHGPDDAKHDGKHSGKG